MKVAFVSQPWSSVVPPVQSSDSIAIWIDEITRQLSDQCETIIYSRCRFPKKTITNGGITYRYIPTRPFYVNTQFIYKKLLSFLDKLPAFREPKRPLFASPIYYIGYILQVAYDIKARQCDIVHVFNFSQFVSIIRAVNPQVKIVLNMHCDWLTQLDKTILESRLRKTDLILGCSQYITQRIARCFPDLAPSCRVVYNGVDVKQYFPKHSGGDREKDFKKLLFVGRVSPEKGIHTLLKAFERVVELYPNVRLEIVGHPSLIPYDLFVALSEDPKVVELASFYPNKWLDFLNHWSEHSRASSQVIFIGHVAHSELFNYYSHSDIFVFPSVCNEAFGVPVIEGMAMEIPIVATWSGGVPEIVEPGQTGLLVERGNVEQLAEAIVKLLRDDELSRAMGEAGKKRVIQKFSLDNVVARLLSLYRELCPN